MLALNPSIPRNVLRRALKVPVLVHVFRETDAITVRTFAEIDPFPDDGPYGNEAEARVLLASHLAAIPGVRHYGAQANEPEMFFRREWLDGSPGRPLRLLSAATLDRRWPLGSGEWTDFATWVWPIQPDGKLGTPFNRELLTRESRSQKWRLFTGQEVSSAFQLFLPFAGWNFDSCQTYILAHPRQGFVANFPIDHDLGETDEPNLFKFQEPRIVIGGPGTIPAGERLDLPVRLQWNDGSLIADAETLLFAEAVSGFLPRSRVEIAQGEGSLRVMALGLDAGERVRIKLGFRNWLGATDKLLSVI